MSDFSVHIIIAYVVVLAAAVRTKPTSRKVPRTVPDRRQESVEIFFWNFPDGLFDEPGEWRRCTSYVGTHWQDDLRCQRPHFWENAIDGEDTFWDLSSVPALFEKMRLVDAVNTLPQQADSHVRGLTSLWNVENTLSSTKGRQAILLYDAWDAFLQYVQFMVPPHRELEFEEFDTHDMWYRLTTTDACPREDGCMVACMRFSTLGNRFLACYELRSDLPTGNIYGFINYTNPREQFGLKVPKLLHFYPELTGLSPENLEDVAIIAPGSTPLQVQSLRMMQQDEERLDTKIQVAKASEFETSFCFGTWNLGSEQQISFGGISAGPGVGSGGATQNDLIAGLREILQSCAAADFIAVTLQEIDDLRLPAYVKLLLGQLTDISSMFDRHYEYLGLVYAEQRTDESSSDLHVHQERFASSANQGVVVFAFGLSDRLDLREDPQAYSVSFGKATFGRETARKLMGTSAHKGGAFLKVPALLPSSEGMAEMMVCFAGVHLDAKGADKRQRGAQLVVDFMRSEKCHVAVIAGDFNPRIDSESCCPARQMAWLLERQKDSDLIRLAVDHDEILHHWTNQEWWYMNEQEISFLPTFHKFVERSSGPSSVDEVTDEYGNKFLGPYKSEDYAIRECPEAGSPGETEERMVEVIGSSTYNQSDYDWYWKDHACDEIRDDHICYGGIFSSDTCRNHLCYNIHDRSHCPGYTDRVFFGDARANEGDFPLRFKHKLYNSLEHVSGGDHTPVVAMFAVEVGSKIAPLPPIRPRNKIEVGAWITLMEKWTLRSIVWPNGSGRLCFRKTGMRSKIMSNTGCPRYESCYEIADKHIFHQIRYATFKKLKGKVVTHVDWTEHMLRPYTDCRKNDPGTWGVCASNVQNCVTELHI